MELSNILLWRYATKAMNGKKVDDDKVERILEAIRYAPSSNGLQPFEILVVENIHWKERIKLLTSNHAIITDSSHLIIFAAWDNVTADRINTAFEHVIAERGNYQGLNDYRQALLESYGGNSVETNFNHAARQAYLSLGFGLIAAANEMVDATPMEGFDPPAVDELLGLQAKGLRSVAMMAIGYRDTEKDWLVNMKKVRKPKAEFITEII